MPDPIKSLFEATRSKRLFLDEADLKNQIAKDPNGVFNIVSDSKLFLDFDDFQNALGLKKKETSPFIGPSSTQSFVDLPWNTSIKQPVVSQSQSLLPSGKSKSIERIESFSADTNDFFKAFQEDPKKFTEWASTTFPTISYDEIKKSKGGADKSFVDDAFIFRISKAYEDKKNDIILQNSRTQRKNIEGTLQGNLTELSKVAGKDIQIPTTIEQAQQLMQELKPRPVTDPATKPAVDQYNKTLEGLKGNITGNLNAVIGSIVLRDMSARNPNVTPIEIGREVMRLTNPELFKQYEAAGGGKPYGGWGGIGVRETPVYADDINRQMTQIGNEIMKMYGNKTAIERANLEEKVLQNKFTYGEQERVKNKIASALYQKGVKPTSASQDQINQVVESLPEEDKSFWKQAQEDNNAKLPSTGFGYSLKNGYSGVVTDAVKTLLTPLIPNKTREQALENLKSMSSSDVVGENPQEVSRFEALNQKKADGVITAQETAELEDLKGRVRVRTGLEKILDFAGGGAGQIAGLGTISAFTGGLSQARTVGGVLKSLALPSGGSNGISAAAYLMANEGNQKEAMRLFPDSDVKQALASTAFNAIDMLVERLFPEEQVLTKTIKNDIVGELSKISRDKISEQLVDNVAKQAARTIVRSGKEVLKAPLQETAEEEIAMVLKDAIVQPILNPEFSKDGVTLKKIIETGEQAFWGAALLGAPKGLMALRDTRVPIETIWNTVSSPTEFIKINDTINKMEKAGEITAEDAQEKRTIIAQGIKEYNSNPVVTGQVGKLSLKERQNYFARLMHEKTLENQMNSTTDDNVKADLQSKINDSKAQREKIFKNQVTVNEDNREMPAGMTEEAFNIKERLKTTQGLTDADFVAEPFTPEEDAADREALPQSQFGTEADLENTLKTGQFAMLTGMNPSAQPISKAGNKKLNERAKQWLIDKGFKPIEIFGKYDNSERSFFVPDMTREQAIEFAKEFGQEAVAHSSGMVYQDGSFNPRTGVVEVAPSFGKEGANYFSSINIGGKPVDFKVDYDTNKRYSADGKLIQGQPTDVEQRLSDAMGDAEFMDKVAAAQKSLEKTGVSINVIDNADEYDRITGEAGGQKGTEGIFVSDDGKIYINKAKLEKGITDGLVVWHEAAHPVVNIVRNTNRSLFDSVVNGVKELAKTNKDVADALAWAEKEYQGQETVDDEAVVEVIARVADGIIDLNQVPTGFKQSLIDLINKMAKALGLGQIVNDTDVAAIKKLAGDVANALTTGRDISEVVGAENVKEYGVPFPETTTIVPQPSTGNRVSAKEEGHTLSFVKPSDIIDIDALIKDIASKGEKVWFWTADQLGRGMYYDKVIDGEHYLDAGPSFALDPTNRDNNIIWATGKGENWVKDKIANSNYIFIISGSPLKSKLFNKRVAEITINRIKNAIGEKNTWDNFKKNVLEASKITKLNDIVKNHDSFESLLASPDRKEFLIQIDAQREKKATPLKALLDKYNAFVDYNELRDGFYKDNDFNLNDIMLVLKPTGFGGKSKHSTYENDVLGEVVGVPDKKVNAFDIMPVDFKAKYSPEISRTEQSQAVAPYGAGVREVQASKGGRNLVSDAGLNKQMTSDDKGNYVFYHYSGSKIKSIDPKKFGKNLATGKDERPGVGISMYYTRPDIKEANVPSEFGYVVRIPENQVYPFNEDPLDLLPEAEKQFKKQYPGQAFDFNKQVGFVTKVAADRGYPMTVAEWNIKGRKVLRAQTTEAMKPEIYQEKVFQDGYQVTKTTPELEFKPNAKRIQASKGRIATDTQIINGFYSPIENRINDFKQHKASVQKWKEIVGVKSDEAVFSGLADWLNSQKPESQLTKDDVINFIKDNRIQIKEVERRDSRTDATKYSQYQLPGGKDYKEVLITLPIRKEQQYNIEERSGRYIVVDKFTGSDVSSYKDTKEEAQKVVNYLKKELNDQMVEDVIFKSSHFDEPNIIAHLRMNTRTDVDGKKVLFLEEVQSDWGQTGKREGFSGDLQKKNDDIIKKSGIDYEEKGGIVYFYKDGKRLDYDEVPAEVRKAIGKKVNEVVGIPSAPYVTNTNAWVKLGLKVALKEAVKQGADRIAWTTGDQQNERYDLGKQVDKITVQYDDANDLYSVSGTKADKTVFSGDFKESELEQNLGKNIAEDAIKNKDKTGPLVYEGDGLKIGGKGMKAFYGDTNNPGIVANVAKALVKELTGKDGQIVQSDIFTSDKQYKIDVEQNSDGTYKVTVGDDAVYGDSSGEGFKSYLDARNFGVQRLAEYKSEKNVEVQPAIDITPELKISIQGGMPQFSVGRRDLDQRLKNFVDGERAKGTSDADIERAIRNRFPLIDQQRMNAIMGMPTVAEPTPEEKLATVVQPEGEERTRGMEKRFGDLDEDTARKIEDEAKTYFAQTNKQTEKAAEEFMKGKPVEYMADYVVSNPNIPGAVNVWMAATTAKNLGKEIEAAKKAGDVNRVEMLSTMRANIYNHFASKATEIGQTIQAFISFKDDPAANQFMFNKILKQLQDKGVTAITDAQKTEIKRLLDEVSTAPAGLPKDIAITKLSHYLGKMTPINAFDIMQAMWYAKILSGITTQSKNFFANMINTFVEVPIVGLRMSFQTGSLQPMLYAMKGLGGGSIKGLVKAADILKGGVTTKQEDKFFNNDNLLEYFKWSDTKIGKTFGGMTGKILDFPLFFETSPTALKYVGRALTASDALFSTANQEAMANMLAFAQAKSEGKSMTSSYARAQEILGNTKKAVGDAKKQAADEGFKPKTTEFKRRVIEIVNQQRGQDIVEKAQDFGKRATLTNEPEGFTRGIYQVATNIQEKLPIARVVIPFTKIVSNISEMLINYSPLGMYRAATGIKNPKFTFKFTPSGDNKLTPEQRADLFIKSTLAITTLTILAGKTGDKEEDWFDVTAGGPTDFAKKYELMKGGWRPYTITMKDGTKINYADWPIAGVISAIGTIHDADRYGNVDTNEWQDKMAVAAYAYMLNFYDKSLVKGISDFVDIFRPEGKYGPDTNMTEKAIKFGTQQAKAVTMSNLSQQALKLVDEYQDEPIKEAKGAEVFYRDIPLLNDGLNPIIDVFGDEVKYATTERLLPWMSVGDEKKDEVLAYLNRNNVFVGMAAERPMINFDTLEERKMTRDELYQYRKLAGQYTKEMLYDNIDLLKEINAMEDGAKLMKKTVADFASASRDKAYAEVLLK